MYYDNQATTPIEAIHNHCALCTDPGSVLRNDKEIRLCRYEACPLSPYRLGRLPKNQKKLPKLLLTPLRACRTFCLEECQTGGPNKVNEVRNCQGDTWVVAPCPLFRFRFGRNPNISAATRQKQRVALEKKRKEGKI